MSRSSPTRRSRQTSGAEHLAGGAGASALEYAGASWHGTCAALVLAGKPFDALAHARRAVSAAGYVAYATASLVRRNAGPAGGRSVQALWLHGAYGTGAETCAVATVAGADGGGLAGITAVTGLSGGDADGTTGADSRLSAASIPAPGAGSSGNGRSLTARFRTSISSACRTRSFDCVSRRTVCADTAASRLLIIFQAIPPLSRLPSRIPPAARPPRVQCCRVPGSRDSHLAARAPGAPGASSSLVVLLASWSWPDVSNAPVAPNASAAACASCLPGRAEPAVDGLLFSLMAQEAAGQRPWPS